MNILKYFDRPYTSWFPRKREGIIEKLDSIDIDIVSHCNLNCKGCSHFSPVAKPWFIEPDNFERDITRLSEVIPEDKIGVIFILGGEPLLHPEICLILETARRVFNKLKITVITNGFLLPKMGEEFWNVCGRNRIEIEITKYPINFDYKPIFEQVNKMKNKVKVVFKGRTKFFKKKQYFLPIDLDGKQDATENFQNCFMARHCINLSKGKLYTCSYAACMDKFNEYFGKHVPITDKDGVNIYQYNSYKEIFQKLSEPISLCKYCAVNQRTYGNDWGTSKLEISEWTLGKSTDTKK